MSTDDAIPGCRAASALAAAPAPQHLTARQRGAPISDCAIPALAASPFPALHFRH